MTMPMEATSAGSGAHFGTNDIAQRAAVSTGRECEYDKILNGTGEDDPGQDPERSGKIAHLSREHRPDQRSCAGDGGEMVAEQDESIGRHIVEAVLQPHSGRYPSRIQPEHLRRDKLAVKAVSDGIGAQCRGDHPSGIHWFAPRKGQHCECCGADYSHGKPAYFPVRYSHIPPDSPNVA